MPRTDKLFEQAVAYIDRGDEQSLCALLDRHPDLARARLDRPGIWLRSQIGPALKVDSFFHRPFLLWFVPEDAVRTGKLAPNAIEIARLLIERAGEFAERRTMLDYGLRLTAWSWVARESGLQIRLIDMLVESGAKPGSPIDPLVNGNSEAAEWLIHHGAPDCLAAALCSSRFEDARLLSDDPNERQIALILCAMQGRAEALRWLLPRGVDLSQNQTGIHEHGTALHHAVSSGDLESVELLIAAGASTDVRDTAWNGTPIEWAEHMAREKPDDPRFGHVKDWLASR